MTKTTKGELEEIKLKEQEGEEKLTLGSKEEKNTGQASKRTEIWSAESKRKKSEAKEK